MNLYVATQYTRNPGPRFKSQSPSSNSGQEFRDKLLLPRLRQCIESKDMLYCIFDGCSGAGVSFLEESFGGLIRAGIAYSDIKNHLTIVWKSMPRKVIQANSFIEKAYHDKLAKENKEEGGV